MGAGFRCGRGSSMVEHTAVTRRISVQLRVLAPIKGCGLTAKTVGFDPTEDGSIPSIPAKRRKNRHDRKRSMKMARELWAQYQSTKEKTQ